MTNLFFPKHFIFIRITGFSCQQSVTMALDFMKKRVNGHGGAIAIDKNRNIGLDFTTQRMPWAYVKCDTLHFGLEEGTAFQESIV